ncbi:hypothetical protein CLF_101245, partial [Clonorchis sinensis]
MGLHNIYLCEHCYISVYQYVHSIKNSRRILGSRQYHNILTECKPLAKATNTTAKFRSSSPTTSYGKISFKFIIYRYYLRLTKVHSGGSVRSSLRIHIWIVGKRTPSYLTTYEKNVLDTCSMWLNNTMIVDLLFKCTRQFTHRSSSHPDVEEQRGPHKTTFRVCNHSCDQNQQTIQLTRSFGRNAPQIAKRSLVKERNLTIYHSYTKNRSRRSLDNVHVAKFTLLIDELSWANGNPRFVYNRPVFFIAQSAVCLSKNMRLVIVYGQYCFDA